MQEFQKNMQALRVINCFAKGLAKGNCRGFSGDYAQVDMRKAIRSKSKMYCSSYHVF